MDAKQEKTTLRRKMHSLPATFGRELRSFPALPTRSAATASSLRSRPRQKVALPKGSLRITMEPKITAAAS